jgi:hypothetical protein
MMLEKKIAEKSRKLNWGPTDASLPIVTPEQIKSGNSLKCINHNEWFVIDGYVIDVSSFKSEHPGGTALLEKYFGRDATKSFDGFLQTHSLGARMLVQKLRVAKVGKITHKRRDSVIADLTDNIDTPILSQYSNAMLSDYSDTGSMSYKKFGNTSFK